MMFWTITNTALSALVAMMLVYKLQCHASRCSLPERMGIAMIAAGMVMNIGPIIAKQGFPFGEGPPTPFDDWASVLLRIGLLVYFAARVSGHWRANRAQVLISTKWLNNRKPSK